ncbi:hypothetical protein GOBAR_AA04074 [Gossypium barbadense]|uniref:Uncharacterized protein n=1 Tax=Gossypium barbadense TaxID=3634 RepID=A0A2P5YLJ6_GOSBA|nr:hypothetical protein GOBAR_AA04074 [Gossypium barbadense]
MLIDLTAEQSISWRDKLVDHLSKVDCKASEEKEDFDILEGDINKSFINGIPSINFSDRVYQILIRDTGMVMWKRIAPLEFLNPTRKRNRHHLRKSRRKVRDSVQKNAGIQGKNMEGSRFRSLSDVNLNPELISGGLEVSADLQCNKRKEITDANQQNKETLLHSNGKIANGSKMKSNSNVLGFSNSIGPISILKGSNGSLIGPGRVSGQQIAFVAGSSVGSPAAAEGLPDQCNEASIGNGGDRLHFSLALNQGKKANTVLPATRETDLVLEHNEALVGGREIQTRTGRIAKKLNKLSHGRRSRFKPIGGPRVRLKESMAQLAENLSTYPVAENAEEGPSFVEDHQARRVTPGQ